jgi:hypothetical protein
LIIAQRRDRFEATALNGPFVVVFQQQRADEPRAGRLCLQNPTPNPPITLKMNAKLPDTLRTAASIELNAPDGTTRNVNLQ